MRLVWWMVGACGLSSMAAMALFGIDLVPEILLGMLGPLVMMSVTWWLMERTYKRSPEQLTPMMIKAFGGKAVFFGGYVAVMLTALSLRPVPFVVSFTSYFIALYVMGAFTLRRLLAAPRQAQGVLSSSKDGGAPL